MGVVKGELCHCLKFNVPPHRKYQHIQGERQSCGFEAMVQGLNNGFTTGHNEIKEFGEQKGRELRIELVMKDLWHGLTWRGNFITNLSIRYRDLQ